MLQTGGTRKRNYDAKYTYTFISIYRIKYDFIHHIHIHDIHQIYYISYVIKYKYV